MGLQRGQRELRAKEITILGSFIAVNDSSLTPLCTCTSDSTSISFTSLQLGDALSTPSVDSSGRTRRPCPCVETYNVKLLSGVAIYTPR
jgi:hypothetical protein